MASNSEHGQWWTADLAGPFEDEPLDAGLVRDGVANNAQHLIDSVGQTLISRVTPDHTTFNSGTLYTQAVSTTNWQQIDRIGPFPVRLRNDGWTLGCGVRLALSQGTAGSVTWTATLLPFGVRGISRVLGTGEAGLHQQWSREKTSTALAWQSTASGTPSIHLSPDQVAAALREFTVPITDGGTPEDVSVVLCDLEIGVQMSSSSLAARLHGVVVHEHDSGDYP